MNETYQQLRDFISGLDIIDTHEHLPPYESARPMANDVLAEYLTHYMSSDLVSAGLTPEGLQVARDSGKPLRKRWQLVGPFWEACRHGGYARSLDIAARDLYGVGRIDARTIEPLNEAFHAARAKG